MSHPLNLQRSLPIDLSELSRVEVADPGRGLQGGLAIGGDVALELEKHIGFNQSE